MFWVCKVLCVEGVARVSGAWVLGCPFRPFGCRWHCWQVDAGRVHLFQAIFTSRTLLVPSNRGAWPQIMGI